MVASPIHKVYMENIGSSYLVDSLISDDVDGFICAKCQCGSESLSCSEGKYHGKLGLVFWEKGGYCLFPMVKAMISLTMFFSLSLTASSTAISQNGFIDIFTLFNSTPELSALTLTWWEVVLGRGYTFVDYLHGEVNDSFDTNQSFHENMRSIRFIKSYLKPTTPRLIKKESSDWVLGSWSLKLTKYVQSPCFDRKNNAFETGNWDRTFL